MPSKPPLSIVAQISLLIQRGLDVPDDDAKIALARLLADNSYARLTRYWRYAQLNPTHGNRAFPPGTTVANLADAYRFDSALRRVLTDGLADFEITLRSRLGYFMAVSGLTHDYRDKAIYRTIILIQGGNARDGLLDGIERDLRRSREDFIAPVIDRGDTPPLWDAMEVLSLGSASKMYSLLSDDTVRHQVARSFNYPHARFAESIFRSLTVVRNFCAHHARIWNRANVQVPPAVLNRLKTDLDQGIYQSTPWAWLVVLADLVDTIRRDNSYSTALWSLVNAHPQYIDGLKWPRSA